MSRGQSPPADHCSRDGVEDALAPLLRLAVRRLVVAGDLLEDARCDSPVNELTDWLERVGIELAGVVPGNHDRGLRPYRERLPVCPDGVRVGAWRVVHGDGPLGDGPVVQGHVHPCLRWGRVALPCYLEGEDHLVLPAFSADAAGVNVLRDVRWRRYRCHAVAGDRVLDFGEVISLRKRTSRLRPK